MAAIHKYTYMNTNSIIDPSIQKMYDNILKNAANQPNIRAISLIIQPYKSELQNIHEPAKITQITANLWCYILENLYTYTEDKLKTLSFLFMNLEEEGITGFILTNNRAVRRNIKQCQENNTNNSITFVFDEALQPDKNSIPNNYKRYHTIIKLSNTCVRTCLDTVIKSKNSHSRNRNRSRSPERKGERKGGSRRNKSMQKKLKSITRRKKW
jgi:hypothetical protein